MTVDKIAIFVDAKTWRNVVDPRVALPQVLADLN
uniref:Uncharacterized protein n=1 Tax=Candidozyma auris TaxID=498019 RepID=A0A0L0P6L5_CANAR